MIIPVRKSLWLPGQPKPPAGSPLDPAHPLCQGLIGAWFCNEGAGRTLYDLTGNAHMALLSGATRHAKGLRANDVTAGHARTSATGTPFSKHVGAFTVVARATRFASSASYDRVFAIRSTANQSLLLDIGELSGNGVRAVICGSDAATYATGMVSGGFPANTPATLAAIFNVSTLTVWSSVTSSAQTLNVGVQRVTDNNSYMALGGDPQYFGSNPYSSDMLIEWCFAYARALSLAEIKLINELTAGW